MTKIIKCNTPKLITVIIVLIAFTGCNPFISKDLRKKNRCNRKLERVVRKCPDLLKTDTLIIPVKLFIPKIEIRDSLSVRLDTLELLKYIDKEKIKYVVKSIQIDTLIIDSLYRLQITLSNGVLNYDMEIYQRTIRSEIKKPIKVVNAIKLTVWEHILNFLGKFWKWIIILLIIISLFFIYSYLNYF